MHFDQYVGIDYSGRGTTATRTSAIQVYQSTRHCHEPECVFSPSSSVNSKRNWCRAELVDWLIDQFQQEQRLIACIDHGFSMPLSYFKRYRLDSWDGFLKDFCNHWPTHHENIEVDSIRKPNGKLNAKLPRTGKANEFRVTERWTSSAKSVFQFDMQGSVAKSTHAGIPWLHTLRTRLHSKLHFWPFDGWRPDADKSVIAEVFPSIFRNRYPRAERTVDQQDAYCVAKWLAAVDDQGVLSNYFQPPITNEERTVSELEGWILGVS